ncbi:MAG: protein kinase [Planctomycetota bacterium]
MSQSGTGSDAFDPTLRRGARRELPPPVTRATTPLPPPPQTIQHDPTMRATRPLPPPPSASSSSASSRVHAVSAVGGWTPLDDRLAIGDLADVHLQEDGQSQTGRSAIVPLPQARYTGAGEIARGGMGVIRRMVDNDLGREVAMKVILDRPDEDAIVRFVREARIGGQLEHPGIPPVHELGIDPLGNVYFTMKLVRGESLAQRIQRLRDDLLAGNGDESFPFVQRLEVFKKVCDAMAFAHAHGVIHRDLKPDNIMVGRFGEVLVMDWGLARLPSGSSALESQLSITPTIHDHTPSTVHTMQGEILGTPAYMAPEQARGQIDRLDRRSDVFALGTILYEMLTLRRAHEGRTVFELLGRVIEGKVVPPGERVRTDAELATTGLRVPPEMDAIVRKAMELRPRARYDSAAALKADIEQFESGGMVGAAQYSTMQRAARWVRKHRRSLAAAAIVMVCAAIAVLAALRAADAAREAAVRDSLAAHRSVLDDAEQAAAAIRTQLDSGSARDAMNAAAAFPTQFAASLQRVSVDALVEEHQPEWSARSRVLPAEVAAMHVQAATRIVADTVASLPPPERAMADDVARAEQWYRHFGDWLEDPAMAPLPVSAFALWLAKYHEASSEAGHEATMRRWIGEAWATQPGSTAACDAIRLLAAHGDDADRAVMQLYRALSAATSDDARVRLSLDLAERLAVRNGAPPFDSRTDAREVALRLLLKLVTPAGDLRPDVRESLHSDPTEIGERIRMLLLILRRVTALSPDEDAGDMIHLPGVDAPRFWRVDDNTFRLREAVAPTTPGGEPWRFRDLLTIDLAPLRAACGAADDTLPGFLPPTAVSAPIFTFRSDRKAKDHWHMGVVAIESLENPRVVSQMDVPHIGVDSGGHFMWAVGGDVDNDGRGDLLFPEVYGWSSFSAVRVSFGKPDGSFTAPQLLLPREDLGSIIQFLLVDDLDGDGANEILFGRSAWNHFTLEVFRIGRDRRLPVQPVVREYSAPRKVELTTDPDGKRLIIMASALDKGPDRFYAIRKIPVPFLGLSIIRFDGQKFVDAGAERMEKGINYVSGPFSLGSRLQALMIADPPRWLIYDGPLPAARIKRVVRLSMRNVSGQGEWISTQSRWYRPLSDEDLNAIAAHGVALAPQPAGDQTIAMARFLLDVGLPAGVAGMAERAMKREGITREAFVELNRLRLQGLINNNDLDALIEVLDELEPVEELAPTVRDLLVTVIARNRMTAAATRIAGKWANGGSLSDQRRKQFLDDFERWTSVNKRINAGAVDIRGDRVITPDGERRLADVAITSRPGVLSLVPGADGSQQLLARTATDDPTAWLERDLQTDGAWKAVADRQVDTAGVPVRFNADYIRVVLDMRVDCGASVSLLEIGVHTLRDFPGNGQQDTTIRGDGWSQGLRVRMLVQAKNDRSNQIVGFTGKNGGEFRFEQLRERWIRVDLEYQSESGQARLVVADADTGEVLHHARAVGLPPPGGGMGVLGVRSIRMMALPGSVTHVRIRRLTACGEVQLVPPDDAELLAVLGRTQGRDATEAFRAQLRGDHAAEGQILAAMASQFEQVAAATTDPNDRVRIVQAATRLRLDAAKARGQLASALATMLQAPGGASMVWDWLMQLPETPDQATTWDDVGRAVAERMTQGSPAAAAMIRADLLQRVARRQIRSEDVLFTPWLSRQMPRDTDVQLAALAVLATAWSPGSRLPLDHRDVVGRQFLRIAKQYPEVVAGQPPLATAQLQMLARELRRAELLQLGARIANPDADVEDVLDITRELNAECDAEMRASRLRVMEDPVPTPEFPRFAGD